VAVYTVVINIINILLIMEISFATVGSTYVSVHDKKHEQLKRMEQKADFYLKSRSHIPSRNPNTKQFKSQGKLEEGTAHRGDTHSYVRGATLTAVFMGRGRWRGRLLKHRAAVCCWIRSTLLASLGV
jgi:hypothetical protein